MLPARGVHAAGGFVQEDHGDVAQQCAGHPQATLLTPRQSGTLLVHLLLNAWLQGLRTRGKKRKYWGKVIETCWTPWCLVPLIGFKPVCKCCKFGKPMRGFASLGFKRNGMNSPATKRRCFANKETQRFWTKVINFLLVMYRFCGKSQNLIGNHS